MNLIYWMLVTLLAVALLTGCRSSRHAARTDSSTDAYTGASQVIPPVSDTEAGRTGSTGTVREEGKKESANEDAESKDKKTKKGKKDKESRQVQQRTTADAVTAKLQLALKAGSKKMNLGGTYRLKRNEVVQMNLTFQVLFVNVSIGTLELTPDYVLLLDRYHKRYCKVTYAEVPSLAQAGINFDYLQSIFWGEAGESPTPLLDWKYDRWQPLADGQFPGQIEFSMKSGSAQYKAEFNLSNLSTDGSGISRTAISQSYTPMSLDAAMSLIMSVAQ